MFSNPKLNVAQLGLKEGMNVADFGAGTGLYSKEAALKVGSTGKVYAIEIQKDMVRKLENDLKEWGVSNVNCIWGDIEKVGGTKISDSTMDAVILSNVLFQSSDKLGLIDETKRLLKHNGKVLLIDWSDSFNGMGPAPHHVVTEKTALDFFTKRGFKILEKISPSSHHYGIIFIHE
ncbi:MAG: class I SAM-dependent methyltransferase [Patescibacteria group bacterium]|nr:class I SAM-dependent methyltransferase [Patescibacteria group bacterium]